MIKSQRRRRQPDELHEQAGGGDWGCGSGRGASVVGCRTWNALRRWVESAATA